MNTARQFWTLCKFQMIVSPFMWVVPFAFGMPLFFLWRQDPSLNLLILNQNTFLVGLLGALLLTPEIFTSAATCQSSGLGAEFIQTRAVDKDILARARSACYYFSTLIVPVAIVLWSLRSPNLPQVSIYPRAALLDCLRHVPGSALVDRDGRSDLVSIPAGKVLVAAWHVWEFLALAVAVQVLVYAIHPLRHRRILGWALILSISLAPLPGIFFYPDSVAWDQHLFFCYTANQPLFWILAVTGLIVGQIWSERRFAALQQ